MCSRGFCSWTQDHSPLRHVADDVRGVGSRFLWWFHHLFHRNGRYFATTTNGKNWTSTHPFAGDVCWSGRVLSTRLRLLCLRIAPPSLHRDVGPRRDLDTLVQPYFEDGALLTLTIGAGSKVSSGQVAGVLSNHAFTLTESRTSDACNPCHQFPQARAAASWTTSSKPRRSGVASLEPAVRRQ